MRLATPRSTPRDDPNHHYLWVIVGMLYVSQGSAWRCGRQEVARGLCRCSGVGGAVAGPGWVAVLWLPRAYIARTNPNGNSSLGGASPIMHTPVLTGRPCSRSLLVSPRPPLSSISPPSLALSRFYPISSVTFVPPPLLPHPVPGPSLP